MTLDRNCYNCIHSSWYPSVGATLGPQPAPPEDGWVECDGQPDGLSFLKESHDRQVQMGEFSCEYWERAISEDFRLP